MLIIVSYYLGHYVSGGICFYFETNYACMNHITDSAHCQQICTEFISAICVQTGVLTLWRHLCV